MFYEVDCIGNSRLNKETGKWEPFRGLEMQLPPSERLPGGGIAILMYAHLLQCNEDTLINEANNDILIRTRKDKEAGIHKHYFSHLTGILVNVWNRTETETTRW